MAAPRDSVKLTRVTKRSLGLGLAHRYIKDKHHYGEIKRLFTDAEKHYVDVKNRRTAVSSEE
jgi:hypothetical protein